MSKRQKMKQSTTNGRHVKEYIAGKISAEVNGSNLVNRVYFEKYYRAKMVTPQLIP